MTTHYDPQLKCWLIRCPLCRKLVTYVYGTRTGNYCKRCLKRVEKEAA